MAASLPDPFKWESNNNQQYLRLHDGKIENIGGILEFTEEDPNRIFSAVSGSHSYVNIKCSPTSLYLVRAPSAAGTSSPAGTPFLVVATAKTPNQNTNDPNCTLFELFEVGKDRPGVFRVRHVQSGLYLRPRKFGELDAALFAVSPNHDNGEVDLFTITGI